MLPPGCFKKGALTEGQGCPACSEPLWVPRVEKRRAPGQAADDDDCGGEGGGHSAMEAALAAAAEVEAAAASRSNESNGSAPRSLGGKQLRMCPSCCAGPLLNENCADMRVSLFSFSLFSVKVHLVYHCLKALKLDVRVSCT